VPDTLPVHLNREELHAVEVPDAFETSDSFDVGLVNHGTSVHVHLHLDDALSEVASLDASNHFIDGETQRAAHVSVNGSGPVTGKLKIASAYGAQTRYVDVRITEPEETESTVEVDESLSKPQPTTTDIGSSGESGTGLLDSPELVVLVLGALALLVAVVAAVVIDQMVVLLGALVVLAGVLAALFVLRSDS
jgi:hypothetical protein